MTHAQTHCELIRNHLLSGEKITPIEALNFYKCMRLGARIYDLRRAGMSIQSRTVTLRNGKKVSQYYLLEQTIKETQTWNEQKQNGQQ